MDEQTPIPEQTESAPVPPPKPAVPPKKPRRPRRPLKSLLRAALIRVYAFALVLTISGVCLSAMVYLYRFVFTPAQLPPEFARWQGRLEASALRQSDVPGMTTAAGRAPMAHYHKVERWFQPDPGNTCTTAGCHSPLPHDPKTKIATFPNLHVTFLDCTVCHEAPGNSPIAAQWVGLAGYRAQSPPAILRLIALLESMQPGAADTKDSRPQIVALLKEFVAGAGSGVDRDIEDLLIELETSDPGSPVWRLALRHLTAQLPLHARGEYGAKIVRKAPATDSARITGLTRAYLGAPPGGEREKIKTQIHETLIAKPDACAKCHATGAGLLDFAALGYSPRREQVLRALPLARMVEQIRHGESFQLPSLLEAKDGR